MGIAEVYLGHIEYEVDDWLKDGDLSHINEHKEVTEKYMKRLNSMADIITEQRVMKLTLNLWWVLKEKKKENGDNIQD